MMTSDQASADFLVFSGATHRNMQTFMLILVPKGQPLNMPTQQRSGNLIFNDNDSIAYDLVTKRFKVYRSITPFDLLTLHKDFAFYDVRYDTAVYDFNTMLFNVGIDRDQINANMAVTYIGYIGYGEFINLTIDYDGDGVSDEEDAFPYDPNESLDTDDDGIGNNADTDDDNDGIPDWWEIKYNLDPLIDDASEDPDKDSHSNLEEYLSGTDPNIADKEEFPWELFYPAIMGGKKG